MFNAKQARVFPANWLTKTDEDKTALDFAKEGKHLEVIDYLQHLNA